MLPPPREVLAPGNVFSRQHMGAPRQLEGMSRASYLSAFVLAVAACGGSSPQPQPAKPPPPAQRTAADFVPLCQRIFARKQTCADDYLPALLDVRVELNMPPGIGDEVKAKGRDAVLAIAHTELASDTEPAKVTALCENAAKQAVQGPPERADQLLDQAGRCDAAADCKAFSTCVVVIDRGFIAAGAHAHAAPPP
jgi:hypothetical protein